MFGTSVCPCTSNLSHSGGDNHATHSHILTLDLIVLKYLLTNTKSFIAPSINTLILTCHIIAWFITWRIQELQRIVHSFSTYNQPHIAQGRVHICTWQELGQPQGQDLPASQRVENPLKNGWLEYDRFLLGWPIFRGLIFNFPGCIPGYARLVQMKFPLWGGWLLFRGKLAVSFRVSIFFWEGGGVQS